MSWDDRWMELARHVAGWSKDRSRKVGAVIVDDREVLVSLGWNGFPRGVDDGVECRHERPAKYQWTEHAERNAIFNAAAKGVSTLGCRIYLPWFPCADCARAIIQAGIGRMICVEPDWSDPQYGADFRMVREMFTEVDIEVTWAAGEAPVQRAFEDAAGFFTEIKSDETLAREIDWGHGWVKPRPDGMLAKCGGPEICSICQAEAA